MTEKHYDHWKEVAKEEELRNQSLLKAYQNVLIECCELRDRNEALEVDVRVLRALLNTYGKGQHTRMRMAAREADMAGVDNSG